jgi:hypothetical protein
MRLGLIMIFWLKSSQLFRKFTRMQSIKSQDSEVLSLTDAA